MKKTLFAAFILVMASLLVTACFPDTMGNMGSITISIGGTDGGRSIWNGIDFRQIRHEITLTGPDGHIESGTIEGAEGTINFLLEPGLWIIEVTAYQANKEQTTVPDFDDENRLMPFAIGYAEVRVVPGSNRPVSVPMSPVETFRVTFFVWEAEEIRDFFVKTIVKGGKVVEPEHPQWKREYSNNILFFSYWYIEEDDHPFRYDFNTHIYQDLVLYAKWDTTVKNEQDPIFITPPDIKTYGDEPFDLDIRKTGINYAENGDITYRIISGVNVLEIDDDKLKIIGAGEAEVEVQIAGNEIYNPVISKPVTIIVQLKQLRLTIDGLDGKIFTPLEGENTATAAIRVDGIVGNDRPQVIISVLTPPDNFYLTYNLLLNNGFLSDDEAVLRYLDFNSSPVPNVALEFRVSSNSSNYTFNYDLPRCNIIVIDGQADYTADTGQDRRIPVTNNNIEAFNDYAVTSNGQRCHYKLTENIDINFSWVPIGDGAGFSGSFNGNGYSINNILIDNPNSDNQGMFRIIASSGVVKNLGLFNCNIKGRDGVGAIAGRSSGTISNCYVISDDENKEISGRNDVGGIVGINTGIIQNCYSNINVTGAASVGGITGENTSSGKVSNSYSLSIINGTGSAAYAGGIVGLNTGKVENCIALNISITVPADITTTRIGRVVGSDTGMYSNNYAWIGVALINGDTNFSVQGTIINAIQAKSLETWEQAGFEFNANSWTWNDLFMPSLHGEEVEWTEMVDPDLNADTEGTAVSPFIVWNVETLLAVGRGGTINGETWSVSSHYIQMADITLPAGTNWVPIGFNEIGGNNTRFTGTYNGNGYSISNLHIDMEDNIEIGMFSIIDTNAVVEKLGLVNGNIKGRQYVGGITGDNYGTIRNCFVTGNVSGANNNNGSDIGGIAGLNMGSILYCYSTADVRGWSDVGGIAGRVLQPGKLNNCVSLNSNAEAFSSSNGSAGRITGNRSGLGANDISNCYSWTGGTHITASGTSGQYSNGSTVAIGTALTTVFSGWDTSIWIIPSGNLTVYGQLPRLRNMSADIAVTLPAVVNS